MFTFSISVKGGANHDPATKRLPAILFRFTRVHQWHEFVFCDSMDFKWYLWSLVPGVYDSLCGQKTLAGPGSGFGVFAGCRNLPAPMGTRVECGSDDVDRSLFCPVPRDYLVFVLIR